MARLITTEEKLLAVAESALNNNQAETLEADGLIYTLTPDVLVIEAHANAELPPEGERLTRHDGRWVRVESVPKWSWSDD